MLVLGEETICVGRLGFHKLKEVFLYIVGNNMHNNNNDIIMILIVSVGGCACGRVDRKSNVEKYCLYEEAGWWLLK